MTEADWLASPDPLAMQTHLRRAAAGSDRKCRLSACACCRRIWDQFPDQRNRDLVAAVEDHPSGRFEDPEVHDAAVASSAGEHECRAVPAYWVAKYLGRGYYKMTAAESAAIVGAKVLFLADRGRSLEVERLLAGLTCGDDTVATQMGLPASLPPEVRAEAAVQASLLREVFGNPFRPVTFSPSWRTDTALSLAQGMYESRDFGAMPILADALQDAGCTSDDVLEHCRGPGPHVRGCWVVDLVLGKG